MPVVQNAGDLGLIFINPAIQIPTFPRNAWWFADGAIPASNVMEHVESPTTGQSYAGAAIASGQPWTVAAKSTSFVPSSTSRYIIDTQAGRMVLGISSAANYGFFNGTVWTNVAIFPDTAIHIWFLVSDGANIQAYLDNVATGASSASAVGFAASGATRWRRAYDNTTTSDWANGVTKGSIYNIALTATERLALYTSMLNN